ncbi:MAG: hypothetical protein ABJC04_09520, partial [Verrucomicrobiota bacterium]
QGRMERAAPQGTAIAPGENGFVLSSPEAVTEMAEALGQMSDRSVRARLSEKALTLRERLSMRRHAREIFNVYQTIKKYS